MDRSKYYQTNKGRLLAMGSILIVLGLALYVARGVEAALALVAVGIVLLIAGVLWKPRKKPNSRSREEDRVEVLTKQA